MTYPTAEEIFDKPWPTPTVALPFAWQGESIAVELADRECARLIANELFDPPIEKQEIERYSQQFKMPKRQAELEIRGMRHDSNQP
jgi:hypothetical protein